MANSIKFPLYECAVCLIQDDLTYLTSISIHSMAFRYELPMPEYRCLEHMHYIPCSYCREYFDGEDGTSDYQYGYPGILCHDHINAKRCSLCYRWDPKSKDSVLSHMCQGHNTVESIGTEKVRAKIVSQAEEKERMRQILRSRFPQEESLHMCLMRTYGRRCHEKVMRSKSFEGLKFDSGWMCVGESGKLERVETRNPTIRSLSADDIFGSLMEQLDNMADEDLEYLCASTSDSDYDFDQETYDDSSASVSASTNVSASECRIGIEMSPTADMSSTVINFDTHGAKRQKDRSNQVDKIRLTLKHNNPRLRSSAVQRSPSSESTH